MLDSKSWMRPFARITFCCTGLDEQLFKSISKKVLKLGGLLSYDLTSQVNVLIVGDLHRRTDKYEFAVRNRPDIVFLDCNAILELYHLWLAGEDVAHSNDSGMAHVDQSVRMLDILAKRYTLGPLTDYVIFIGRIRNDTLTNVPQLEEFCSAMNCCKCISKHFMSDSKRKFAGKQVVFITDEPNGVRVDAARKENIPVIHYKWILDCYKRNATLQYDPYYLLEFAMHIEDIKEIGRDSCDCWDDLDDPAQNRLVYEDEENRMTQRKSISKRLKPHGDKLWQKVMSSKDSKDQEISSINENEPNSAPLHNLEADISQSDVKDGGIFHGLAFIINDAFKIDHRKILEKVITQHGGNITYDIQDEGAYRYLELVPSHIPIEDIIINKNIGIDSTVTEFFIERCLHYKKQLLPIDSWSSPYLYSTKFKILASNRSNKEFVISITGFSGVELLHLVKMLKALGNFGIKYSEYLDKKTDLLLVNLAVLTSITKDHSLWNNQYHDLFLQNSESITQINQIFRNSLKRKIQFIKEEHCIPMATPAFIIDIFRKAKDLYYNPTTIDHTIHLNNIQWLVLSRKGKKTEFEFKVVRSSIPIDQRKALVDKSVLSSVEQAEKSSDINQRLLKRSASELLQKFKEKPELSPSKSDFTHKRVRLNVIPPEIEQRKSSLGDKIPNLKKVDIQPVIRTTSWGSILAEGHDMQRKELIELPSDDMNRNNNRNPIDQTQVTYGSVSATSSTNTTSHK